MLLDSVAESTEVVSELLSLICIFKCHFTQITKEEELVFSLASAGRAD